MKRCFCLLSVICCLFSACKNDRSGMQLSGDCNVESITLDSLYTGVADAKQQTITVGVPEDYDISSMCVTDLRLSVGATADVAVGDLLNMQVARRIRVTNGDAVRDWTMSVVRPEKPIVDKARVLFVGTAERVADLAPEERAACQWLLDQVDSTAYASWSDFRAGKVDLSACELIWWHFHYDGGIDGKVQFENRAADAVAAMARLQKWFSDGGSLLLTRYATYLPGYLSVNGAAATLKFPNNCWGGKETEPETTSNAWYWFTESPSHPLYKDILKDTNADRIYTCDAGYKLTNSTAQWHLGSDWGGYPTLGDMQSVTGAVSLGHGGDNAVVAWEFPRSEHNGGILCIGSGCYDWYSPDEVYTGYHQNMDRMTLNAINYLLNE